MKSDSKNQQYALLISGHEQHFAEDALRFEGYLRGEAGIDKSHIRTVFSRYHDSRSAILEEMRWFFQMVNKDWPDATVILYYTGHGRKGAIEPNRDDIEYDDLADRICHQGDFIFVNDCCHSGSAIPVFQRRGLLERGLVIAASRPNELARGTLFRDALLGSYSEKKVFDEQVLARYVSGKVTVPFDVDGAVSSAGTERIECAHENIPCKKPIPQVKVQHPVRAGKSLDHILFKK